MRGGTQAARLGRGSDPRRRAKIDSMPSSFTVHDLPLDERPRERMQREGADNISAQELLAVLLGRGVAGQSVMHIAQQLMKEFKSLDAIVNASLEDLQQVKGLGPAKALQLKACLEIARRVMQQELAQEKDQNSSQAVAKAEHIAQHVRSHIRNFKKEHFYVISFDNRNRIIGTDLLTVGTLNASLVHPRETFEKAISNHSASIAVSHNHPSGDPNPSEADIIVTKRLQDAGELMGIGLLDHVIISKQHMFSFKENGLL